MTAVAAETLAASMAGKNVVASTDSSARRQAVSQAKGPRTPHTGIRNWRRGVAGAPLGWDDPRSDPAGVALSGGGGRCGPL